MPKNNSFELNMTPARQTFDWEATARSVLMALFEQRLGTTKEWHNSAMRQGIDLCMLTDALLSDAPRSLPVPFGSPYAWRALGSQLVASSFTAEYKQELQQQAETTAGVLKRVSEGGSVPDAALEDVEKFFSALLLNLAA